MRTSIAILISLLLPFISVAKTSDTTTIYFAYKSTDLDNAAQDKLNTLIHSGDIQASSHITVLGYADYVGGKAYNLHLSQQRANMVKDYLAHQNINKKSIKICMGKGQIDHPDESDKTGNAADRKVWIIVSHETDISKLKTNETLALENIYFLPGSHHITDESKPELEKLYQVLKSHPKLKISIEGHICCETDEQIHFKQSAQAAGGHFLDGFDFETKKAELSTNRAKEIYDYLVEKGIAQSRLSYVGFGATRKIVQDEKTEEDQNKNRRVEIRIIHK
jgi:outer membrane protein OmpA-like peptidoglycan-associated protein